MEEDLRNTANSHDGICTELIDVVNDSQHLRTLIENSQIVVSLLPYTLHPVVADLCIQCGVNMVTASYCTDELMQMHDK